MILCYLKTTLTKKKGVYFKNSDSVLEKLPPLVMRGEIFMSNRALMMEAREKNIETIGMEGRHNCVINKEYNFF